MAGGSRRFIKAGFARIIDLTLPRRLSEPQREGMQGGGLDVRDGRD